MSKSSTISSPLVPLPLKIVVFFFLLYTFIVSSYTDLLYDELTYVIGGSTALRNIATLTFAPEFWSFEFHPPFMMYFYGLSFSCYVFIKAILNHGIPSLNELGTLAAQYMKSDLAIWIFRIPSYLCGAATIVLTYHFGKFIQDYKSSFLAALLLALMPTFIGMSSVAYLEIGMVITQAMAAYLFLNYIMTKKKTSFLLSAVFVGLAAGSKIFAGSIGFSIILFMLYKALKEVKTNGFKKALQLWPHKRLFLFWCAIPPLTLYLVWPWLWTNPLLFFRNLATQMTFKGHGFYLGTTKLGWDFYLVALGVTTPLIILALAIIGLIIMFKTKKEFSIFLLFWFILDIGIISLSKGKHGGYRHIMPAYVPLVLWAGYGCSKVTTFLSQTFHNRIIPTIFLSTVVGWLVWTNYQISPYPKEYFNELVGGPQGACQQFIFADSGLGQKQGIRFIDAHADRNSTVWIWGTKPNAFLYSKRVNIKKSLNHSAVFTARAKHGMAQNESIYPIQAFGQGDLVFHFPYFDEKSKNIPFDQLKKQKVHYVLIHRLFTYPEMFPGQGHNKLRQYIMAHYQPVKIFHILGIPVCWIYHVTY